MPKYRVKGKKTEFILDLPELVDERTKEIIEKTLKKCVEPKDQDKAMETFNRVLSQTNAIIDELKNQDKYHKNLEKDIRKFVGIHIQKGFNIGKKVIQPEEVEVVQKAMAEKMAYEGEVIQDLPKDLQPHAKFIFGCLELGRMALEVGFTLGILISLEKVDKFYKNEADDLSYIK